MGDTPCFAFRLLFGEAAAGQEEILHNADGEENASLDHDRDAAGVGQ